MNSDTQSSWLTRNIGSAFFIFIIAIVGIWQWKSDRRMDAEVFVALETAFLGLLGVTLQISASRRADHERRLQELQQQHDDTMSELRLQGLSFRKETYTNLLRPYKDMMLAKAEGRELMLDRAQILETKFAMALFASDRVYTGHDEMAKIYLKNPTESNEVKTARSAAAIIFMGRVMLEIRKELGNPETKLTEMDMLKAILNDLEENRERLEASRRFTLASEVP